MDAFLERTPMSRLLGWLAYLQAESEDAKEHQREIEMEARTQARTRAERRR